MCFTAKDLSLAFHWSSVMLVGVAWSDGVGLRVAAGPGEVGGGNTEEGEGGGSVEEVEGSAGEDGMVLLETVGGEF